MSSKEKLEESNSQEVIHLGERLTYGKTFRDKSGKLVRYVYSNRKKIGLLVLLAADVLLEDAPSAPAKTNKGGARFPAPNPLFFLE